MPLLVAVVGVPLIIWGARFPVNDGWGYDGLNYGKWTVDFDKWIFGKKMEAYYIGKVLPSGILHYAMRLFDVEPTRINVIRAFQILNLAVLTLAAFTWTRIVRRLALSELAAWIGFLGLFVCFPFLKSALYNPLTINPSGFLLGMLLFYGFLARSQILVFAVCCLGAYTWPSLLPAGMILFVFPRRDAAEDAHEPAPFGLHAAVGLVAALAALWLIDYYVFDKSYGVFNAAYAPHITTSVLYLSVACAMVFVAIAVARLVDGRALYRPSWYVTRETWLGVAVRLVIAVAIYKAARESYAHFGAAGPGPDLEFYFAQVIFGAAIRPLQFLVAHVVLFGPIVILIVLRWREICERLRGMGPGPALFVFTLLLQVINSQSRQLLPYLPFLVGFALLVWQDHLPRLKPTVFAALCFLYSKIWLTIGPVNADQDPRHWPLQKFFMSHGPWMNATMYVAQGLAVLLTFLYLYFVLSSAATRSPTVAESSSPASGAMRPRESGSSGSQP